MHDLRVRRAAAWLTDDGSVYGSLGQLRAASGASRLHNTWSARMTSGWTEVYGGLPARVFDESTVDPQMPTTEPMMTVLVPDRAVAACLWANSVGTAVRGRVVTSASEIIHGLPVLTLHDQPSGTDLSGRVRAAGHRVVHIGPGPRSRRPLIGIRPALLIRWVRLAAEQERDWQAGERRARQVNLLDWPDDEAPHAGTVRR